MKDLKLNIEYWPLDKLLPYARNPRKNDHAVERGASFIKEFGFSVPILVKSDGEIIDGHLRLKCAKKLGMKEVPVTIRDDMTQAQVKAFRLSVNRFSELADWDDELLKLELMELDNLQFDVDLLDFDVKWDDQKSTEGLTDPDDVPDVKQNEFNVKRCDIWLLGNHRLMCGDSTNENDVAKLMNGQKADMVFTDPPYGMSAVQKSAVLSKKYKPIIGDENTDVVKSAVNLILNMNIPTILWGANYYSSSLPDAACWIVWDKNNGGSDQTDCELAWTNFKGVVRQFTQASEKTNRVHPTQKPVSLIDWVFDKYNCGKKVIDLFLGSGSTLIACEKTARICYGMELDEHYCSVIIKRWQDFTGKTAIKEN